MDLSGIDISSLVAGEVSLDEFIATLPQETIAEVMKGGGKEMMEWIEEEKFRHNNEGIRYYEPYAEPTGYQLDFHRSVKPRKLIWKTNRAGGTTVLVSEFIWWATGTHPYRETPKPPVRLRICCVDFEKGIEGNLLPKFKSMVKRGDLVGGNWELGYSKVHRVLNFKNGSIIEFMSYDQDVEKFGGVSLHMVGEDEPCPKPIHNENMARLADTGGTLVIDFTPVNLNARTSWLSDLWGEIKEGDRDWDKFFFDYRNNKSMSEKEKEDFDRSITDPMEREARIYGRFPQFAGLVFKNFSRAKNIISVGRGTELMRPDATRFFGIDPHTREKTAELFMGVNREGEHIVYDEIFEAGNAKTLVGSTKIKMGQDKYECGWMDDYGRNIDNYREASIWEEFVDPDRDRSNKGIYAVPLKMTEKLWDVGVRRIRDLLGYDDATMKPKLFITDNCPLLIHEFETCIYEDFRYRELRPLSEKVKKKGIHLIPCLMFMLLGGAEYVKLRSPQDEEVKPEFSYLNPYVKAGVR